MANSLEFLFRAKLDGIKDVSSQLQSTFNNFKIKPLELSIDDKLLQNKIDNVKLRIESLKAKKINLEIDNNLAIQKLEILEIQLDDLKKEVIRPKIALDIINTEQEINKIRTNIALIGDKKTKVDLDTTKANLELEKLKTQGTESGKATGRNFNESFTTTLNGLKSRLSNIFDIAIGNTVANAITGGLTNASQNIKDFINTSTDEFDRFQKALTTLEIISPRFGIDANKAKEQAQALAKELKIGVGTSAESLQNLFKSGLNLDQATDLLRRFNNEAITGKSSSISLDKAIENLSFGYNTQNSAIGNLSGISENFSDIQERGLKILQARGKLLGKSVQQLDEAQKKEAQYLGIIELTNLTLGSSDKFVGTRVDSQQKLNKAIVDTQVELGKKFDPFLNEILKSLIPIVEKVKTSIANFDSTNLADKFKELAIEVQNIDFNSIIDQIGNLTIKILDFIVKFDYKNFFEEVRQFGETIKTLTPIILGIVAGLAAFNIITSIIAGITALSTALTVAGGVAGVFAATLAFVTAPVTLIALAIAGLVASLVLLYQNWDTVSNFIISKSQDIGNGSIEAFDNLKKGIINKYEEIKAATFNSIEQLKTTTINSFNNLVKGIEDTFNNIKQFIIDTFFAIGETILNFYNSNKILLDTIFVGFTTYLTLKTAVALYGFVTTLITQVIPAIASFVFQIGVTAITAISSFSTTLITQTIPAIASFVFNLTVNAIQAIISFSTTLITQTIPAIISFIGVLITQTIPALIQTGIAFIVNGVKSVIAFATSLVVNGITAISSFVAALITQIIPSLIKTSITFIATALPAVLAFAGGLISTVVPAIFTTVGAILTFLGPIGIISIAVAGLFLAYQTNFLGIRDIINNAVKFAIDNFNKLGEILKTASNPLEFLVESYRKNLFGLKDIVNSAIQFIIDKFSNIKLPELKFPEIKLPEIPKFATGTNNFRGGLATFGERGRELGYRKITRTTY